MSGKPRYRKSDRIPKASASKVRITDFTLAVDLGLSINKSRLALRLEQLRGPNTHLTPAAEMDAPSRSAGIQTD